MKITYGTREKNIDVTEIVYKSLLKNGIIIIPSNDNVRCGYFTDPLVGTLKSVFINDTEYDSETIVFIDNEKVYTIENVPEEFKKDLPELKLNEIHKKLKIKYGTLTDEYPEQIMAVTYLKGHENVLEIGGNIGRNTLVINSILKEGKLVTLECDQNIAQQLNEN